ncbi:hypothetical protein Cgig2_024100 [Carnegiea gigantea]|uniref:Uncharacterized protein n=1 Tax=Carnegiea gigantea TaxID=171969 RepID=A0A9Q1H0M9_9CARY|nr:hypothetical protein Cgig2_024100 [Carnegiea gigantea]
MFIKAKIIAYLLHGNDVLDVKAHTCHMTNTAPPPPQPQPSATLSSSSLTFCRQPSKMPPPRRRYSRMEQSQNSQGGSRMDVSQSSQIGKGRNKRFWTKEEEWALVHGLLEDEYNVLMEMFHTSGFTWDDTTKMIKCERQSNDDFCKNHKHAKGLWGVPFPFLDELGKIFGADRATGASCEDYVEAMDNLHNDNKAINLDKDGEDEEEEEDESVQSAQPSPQLSKRARKEKTSMGKGKKRMSEVIDLTSTFTNVSSNISGFMSGMNSHLEIITSAFTTTQQHEQVILARELHL